LAAVDPAKTVVAPELASCIVGLLPASFASLLWWRRQLTPAQVQQTNWSSEAAKLLAVANIAPLLFLRMSALIANLILAQSHRHCNPAVVFICS